MSSSNLWYKAGITTAAVLALSAVGVGVSYLFFQKEKQAEAEKKKVNTKGKRLNRWKQMKLRQQFDMLLSAFDNTKDLPESKAPSAGSGPAAAASSDVAPTATKDKHKSIRILEERLSVFCQLYEDPAQWQVKTKSAGLDTEKIKAEFKVLFTTLTEAVLTRLKNHNALTDRSLENPELDARMLNLIAILCYEGGNQAIITEQDGIATVIATMQRHSKAQNVPRMGCLALANIALAQENRERIHEAGGTRAILSAMEQHEGDARVALFACIALANLTLHAPLRPVLAHAGAVPAIIAILKKSPAEVIAHHACLVLARLALAAENQALIASHDGIQVILTAAKHHAKARQVIESCSLALRNFSVDEANRSVIFENDGVPTLMRNISTYSDSPSVVEHTLAALANLALKNEGRQRAIAANNGLPTIIQILQFYRGPSQQSIHQIGGHLLANLREMS